MPRVSKAKKAKALKAYRCQEIMRSRRKQADENVSTCSSKLRNLYRLCNEDPVLQTEDIDLDTEEIPGTSSETALPSASVSDDDFSWPVKKEDYGKDGAILHVFPNPAKEKDRYVAWMQALGMDTSLDSQFVCKNRRVCHSHFESKFITWTRRLSCDAVPTLLLPGKDDAEEADDQSNASDQFDERVDNEDQQPTPEIIQVKVEEPDVEDFHEETVEPELLNTILGADGGASAGFKPFVRASNLNLPRVNMFAVIEFISNNSYYTTIDYDKLKPLVIPGNTKLLSGLRVQNRQFVHRVRCNVHLDTSSQCGIEYDTSTHTVTRSECMCACATCEHVAALLLWLHAVSNQKEFDAKLVPEDTVPRVPKANKKNTQIAVAISRGSTKLAPDTAGLGSGTDAEVSLSEPDDPLNVSVLSKKEESGPSTAKRKKIEPATPGSSCKATVFKTKSQPKDTDTKIDESIIKCSFTRKCFFNVWRSTKGNFHEKLRHTRSIMTKAFHDANYVIDFLPLEKRLEELCIEIEGYWNEEVNEEGFDSKVFESKYSDWFAQVENIEMNKTRRGTVALNPGAGVSLRDALI